MPQMVAQIKPSTAHRSHSLAQRVGAVIDALDVEFVRPSVVLRSNYRAPFERTARARAFFVHDSLLFTIPPFKSDIRVEDKRNPNLDVALGLDFLSGILLIQPFMFSLRVILCNILIGSQIFKRLTAPSVLLFMNSKAHMTDFPITSIL